MSIERYKGGVLGLRLKKKLLWVMFRVCGESLKDKLSQMVINMSASVDFLAMHSRLVSVAPIFLVQQDQG